MTKATPPSGNSIEKLLEDRAQFVSWLTRLNSSGEGVPAVPEPVRARVRSDYERRLEAVLDELRGHTTDLEEQVQGLSARHAELTAREASHKEQLSEAEVRHMVGEYDEGKWQGIRAELMKVIVQIREELSHTAQEVERLTEVLGTIRAPVMPEAVPEPPPPAPLAGSGPRPAVAPEPPAPPPPPPVAEPTAAQAGPAGGTELPFRPPTPKPQPKVAPKPEAPGRTLWFPSGKPAEASGGGGKLDELAFLKSVTGSEAPAGSTTGKSRASGGFGRPAETAPPPPPPAPPPPAPEPPAAKAPPAPEPAKPREPPKEPVRESGQKTLKCGECGTLNRPTEWYCERCGAELAAL